MISHKDLLKQNVDLVKLIESLSNGKIVMKVINGGHSWSGRCPHPDHEDRHNSFYVWKTDNGWYWKCYSCQPNDGHYGESHYYGNDCFGFVRWMSDYKGSQHILTFPESIKKIEDFLGGTLLIVQDNKKISSLPVIQNNEQSSYLYDTQKRLAKLAYEQMTDTVRKYIYSRGLEDNDIQQWYLGASMISKTQTVSIPLFDHNNRIIGITHRIINNENIPKYINSKNSPIFYKGQYLYGIHLLDYNRRDIKITEGPFDVMLSYKYGVKNIVSVLGCSFSDYHLAYCKQYGLRPIFCFDNDEAGRSSIQRAIDKTVKQGIKCAYLEIQHYKDLADAVNVYRYDLEDYIMNNIKEVN